ncbi:hypothetical protein PUN28_001027 [Cardiocondyla obscurior]|uniref:Uncharacterized protein n=1 Tax=Cardiocondyla obscurior TaxID=286306 RepID=A0AAW2H2J3_9HYME
MYYCPFYFFFLFLKSHEVYYMPLSGFMTSQSDKPLTVIYQYYHNLSLFFLLIYSCFNSTLILTSPSFSGRSFGAIYVRGELDVFNKLRLDGEYISRPVSLGAAIEEKFRIRERAGTLITLPRVGARSSQTAVLSFPDRELKHFRKSRNHFYVHIRINRANRISTQSLSKKITLSLIAFFLTTFSNNLKYIRYILDAIGYRVNIIKYPCLIYTIMTVIYVLHNQKMNKIGKSDKVNTYPRSRRCILISTIGPNFWNLSRNSALVIPSSIRPTYITLPENSVNKNVSIKKASMYFEKHVLPITIAMTTGERISPIAITISFAIAAAISSSTTSYKILISNLIKKSIQIDYKTEIEIESGIGTDNEIVI